VKMRLLESIAVAAALLIGAFAHDGFA